MPLPETKASTTSLVLSGLTDFCLASISASKRPPTSSTSRRPRMAGALAPLPKGIGQTRHPRADMHSLRHTAVWLLKDARVPDAIAMS